jgi:opacity protein-like surface antigen
VRSTAAGVQPIDLGVRRLLAIAVLAVLCAAAPAAADPLLPPPGQVFAGVTGGHRVDQFAAQTGKHPAVFQFFTSWGRAPVWAFQFAAAAGSRPMLHVSTTDDEGHEVITPGAIARGAGDGYLVALNQAIGQAGVPVYIRLMAEMDGSWNVYSAYGADGRSRGRDHSTQAFRQAWRRFVLIVRGGPVKAIDARLRALGLPPVRVAGATLARVPVAFLWVPQVAGAPDTAANAPRAYWPGGAYVDWVGTDFYSKFPNFTGLERFYAEFTGKPFVFAEWAVWGRDDAAFVHRLFAWIRAHERVRMAIYNQGDNPVGPFRLKQYPAAARALRRELAGRRFPAFAR